MLILLPPSEGKNPGVKGPVDFTKLSANSLNAARKGVCTALEKTCRRDDAAKIIKVGKRIEPELIPCRTITDQPTSPAIEIYSGVLYQAADLNHPELRQVAEKYVRIVSALWGLVCPTDSIPAYRLSMDVELPELGSLAKYWHPYLFPLIAKTRGPILDCCSQTYQKAWLPKTSDELATRVGHLQVTKGGRVVSHWAKHTRGLVTRLLLENAHELDSLRSLAELTVLINDLVRDNGLGVASLKETKKRFIIEVSCAD